MWWHLLSHILSSTCQNSSALFCGQDKLVGGMQHLSKGMIPLVGNFCFILQPLADVFMTSAIVSQWLTS
jgi:hypothetical protein